MYCSWHALQETIRAGDAMQPREKEGGNVKNTTNNVSNARPGCDSRHKGATESSQERWGAKRACFDMHVRNRARTKSGVQEEKQWSQAK